MAGKLKEAMERHRRAAQELDTALRDCLRDLRHPKDNVVEGRFRVDTPTRTRIVAGNKG